jgi:hypothetical protein
MKPTKPTTETLEEHDEHCNFCRGMGYGKKKVVSMTKPKTGTERTTIKPIRELNIILDADGSLSIKGDMELHTILSRTILLCSKKEIEQARKTGKFKQARL